MDLIVGASSTLGSAVARKLLAKGNNVRATARDPKKLEELARLGAEAMEADLRDPDSLKRACQGAEKVLVSVHALMEKGDNRSELVDDQGHRDLIDAAKAAGARHFVYTSICFARGDHPVDFARTKYRVEQYLRQSGLSFTILRPSAYMEFHAHTMIGLPLMQKGKVTLFGRGRTLRSFVAVDDVASYALLALHDPSTAGKVIKISSESLTNLQVVQAYASKLNIQPKVSHVPPAMLRLMSIFMKPFHPGLSRAMLLSYLEDQQYEPIDVTETLSAYPVRPVTFEKWLSQKLVKEAAVGSAAYERAAVEG